MKNILVILLAVYTLLVNDVAANPFTKQLKKMASMDLSVHARMMRGEDAAIRDSIEGRNLADFILPFCPFPLITTDDENATHKIDGFNCAFLCTGTMVSEKELDQYEKIEMSVSGIGLFCALFMVATWGLFAAKAKQKMTFWISVCSLMVTAGIFVAALAEGSPEEVWCKSEIEGYRQEDGFTWCFIQGLFLIFFGLSLCCWWFCSCFDIWSKLYRKVRYTQHYLKYYHLFSWGLPGINALILLSTASFGFEQPRLWCFLDEQSPDSYEFIFFYGWVGALWVGGTIMMAMVIWSILSHTRSYRRGETGGSYFKRLALYKTPIKFVVIFSAFWIVFFSFRLITVIDEDAYIKSAEGWIGCLIAGFTGVLNGIPVLFPHNTTNGGEALLDPPRGANEVGCGEVQTGRIPPGLLLTAVITISANSILVFLIFGLEKENYLLWWNYFKSLFAKKDQYGRPVDAMSVSVTGDKTGKGSITEGMVVRANEAVSTCVELRRGIFGTVYTSFLLLTCQEEEKSATPNRSPRLKFDQPTHATQATTSYTPRYYLNREGGHSTGALSMSTPPPGVPGGPPNYNYSGSQSQLPVAHPAHQSVWSDAYDDPLWGINVEF